MAKREFDVIVWGATGFTGQLVAEYLAQTYGVGGELNWAMGGRSQEKLEQVRRDILPAGERDQLSLVIADSNDPESLDAMVARTSVICSTVGPYARYGTPLVAACAASGTDYCDLTGEVQWMARVIPEYVEQARDSGARIVHTCGFDSIPSDMGTWFLQQQMIDRSGVPAARVKARVGRNRGAASGGTVASMINLMEEARSDPSIRKLVGDPYALYPRGVAPGQDKPDQQGIRFDPDFHQWTAPFVMAVVNTRVVRRTNALLDFAWGEDFRYDEAVLCRSRFRARQLALATGVGMAAMALGPTRKLATRFLPSPGEGPNRKQREAGFYEIFFYGVHPTSRDDDVLVKVTGDMDPGYGSTSKMLGEAAACLAHDKLKVKGGFWTPASAMGSSLLERLTLRAGLTFEIVK